jgi:predicted RNA-binding protein with PIN domain
VTAATVVLVDGSNLAHRIANDTATSVEDRRRELVDRICSWGAGLGHEVVVTFDGQGPYGAGSRQVTPEVEIFGTGPKDADGVLERRARAVRRAGRAVWLVTDDVALRRVAGAGADRITAGTEFLELLTLDARQQRDSSTERPPAAAPPRDTRLADGVDAETWNRLERLRRGARDA